MRIAKTWRTSSRVQSDASPNLDELNLITEAAFFNTEITWLLQHAVASRKRRTEGGATDALDALRQTSKDKAYETMVVRYFCELVAQSAAFNDREVFWEARRSKKYVDVVLASRSGREETLIEFGFFKQAKLADDAKKLASIRNDQGFDFTTRYVILFRKESGTSRERFRNWETECQGAADAAKGAALTLRAASCQDLYEAVWATEHVKQDETLTDEQVTNSGGMGSCLEVALFVVNTGRTSRLSDRGCSLRRGLSIM